VPALLVVVLIVVLPDQLEVRYQRPQLLTGLEDRHRPCRDLNRGAGARIARHARLAIADLGVNEKFKPLYSSDVTKYTLRIYNRWGEKIFETSDITDGWDGIYQETLQPIGVYVWVSEYSFLDGTRNTQSGNLTLMR
jgi:gliding motility-associated-like protein